MQNMSGCSQNKESSSTGSDPAAGEHRHMAGGDFIAGVYIQAKNEKLSIHEAMVRGLLSPGTALVLLEAQAASGLLTEPVRNQQLSVKEALAQGLIGPDFYEKLLSAEGAVTGYTEPYTGHRINLFQATQQEFIVRDHAIRLLQAQVATGGIIDPVHGHRVPVEVAFQRGYLDREMSQVLSDPENQTRSCFDPNTHENLTYLQLLRRCVPDPDTGLLMLQLMDKGSVLYQLSEDARKALQAARTTLAVGLFQGQSVTLWELLFSRYVPEQRRQDLLRRYKAGTVTIAEMIELLTAIVTRTEAQGHSAGVAPKVTAMEVLPESVENGSASSSVKEREQKREQEQKQKQEKKQTQEQEVEQELERSLKSHTVEVSAGGFHGRKVSLWELLFSHYIPEQQREELLRGYKVGTVTILQMTSVLTAAVTGAEGENGARAPPAAKPSEELRASPPAQDTQAQEQQLRKSLKSATVRVTTGEFRGQSVSVLDLLFSRYVPQGKRQELLELYRAGILSTEQVATVVTTMVNRAEAAEAALVGNARSPHRAVVAGEDEDEEDCSARLDDALRSTTITVPAGELQGKQVSLWDLLFSHYIPEEKRQELLELYHERLLTLEQMTAVVTTLIRKKESTSRKFHVTVKSSNKVPGTAVGEEGDDLPKEESWKTTLKTTVVSVEAGEFQGRQVSLWDLLHSHYIPEEKRQELLELYQAGTLALEQMTMVVTTLIRKKESTSRKFHVTVKSSNKVPGTAAGEEGDDLPKEESWKTTLKTTVVSVETGEFQGRQVSLWDLLHSHYIPEEKRQELLELYQAGTLALEQMTMVVTTLIRKKESTSRKFHVTVKSSKKDPGTAAGEESDDLPKEESWKTTLKTTVVSVEAGEFRGHKVSLWDLLHSQYIPEENRKELLELYQAGELTLEQVKTVVTTIVTRAAAGEKAEPEAPEEGPRAEPAATEAEPTPLHEDRTWEETLKATTAEVAVGEFQDRQTSLWDLLFSHHIPEEKRQELLQLYREGTLPIQELLSTTSSLASDSLEKHIRALPAHTMDLLRSEGSYITFGPCQERRVSVWELLSSRQVSEYRREACLDTYPSGGLTVNRITITTTISTRPRLESSHPRPH